MNKLIIFTAALIAAVFTSCTSDEPNINYETTSVNCGFSMIAKYKGKFYNVNGVNNGDTVVYLNKDFNDVYINEISKLPQKAMIVYPDSEGNQIVGYYSSVEELEKDNGISYVTLNSFSEQDITPTRGDTHVTPDEGGDIIGRAILYDDTNYKDRKIIIDISNKATFFYCLHLKSLDGFNDKTSSIRVFNLMTSKYAFSPSGFASTNTDGKVTTGGNLRTCLVGYEDNLVMDSDGKILMTGGDILYCISSRTGSENLETESTAQHQDYKLKNIGWNDKITGVVFCIIAAQDINNTVTPHKSCD